MFTIQDTNKQKISSWEMTTPLLVQDSSVAVILAPSIGQKNVN
jgi:hypothetical protein